MRLLRCDSEERGVERRDIFLDFTIELATSEQE